MAEPEPVTEDVAQDPPQQVNQPIEADPDVRCPSSIYVPG